MLSSHCYDVLAIKQAQGPCLDETIYPATITKARWHEQEYWAMAFDSSFFPHRVTGWVAVTGLTVWWLQMDFSGLSVDISTYIPLFFYSIKGLYWRPELLRSIWYNGCLPSQLEFLNSPIAPSSAWPKLDVSIRQTGGPIAPSGPFPPLLPRPSFPKANEKWCWNDTGRPVSRSGV